MLTDTLLFKGKRRILIKELAAKGIFSEAVLQAMLRLPRHYFLPGLESLAYKNEAKSIGRNQTISHPETVALQSTLLEVKPGDKILEIGTGSGYQAAILAELGAEVYSIERIDELYEQSRDILHKLGYQHKITLKAGDGYQGWQEFQPFDKIIVTAAAPELLKKPAAQLKIGGWMVIPMKWTNDSTPLQKLYVVKRMNEVDFEVTEQGKARFVDMLKGTEEEKWPEIRLD